MIRVNLLPVRAAKKKESVKQQLSVAILSFVGVLCVAGAVYAVTVTKISTTKEEIDKSEVELQTLKKKIGEIDNLKKLQADVKRKLDILNQLRGEKSGPATRLARITDFVPEKLWLTKYVETGPNVSISGIAYSEDLIAQFMRNLQSSEDFGSVELQVSEQTDIAGIKAKKFDLSCVIKSLQKSESAQKK